MSLLKLSKLEVRVLEALCKGGLRQKEVAGQLGLKESSASRVLRWLLGKALVSIEEKQGVRTVGLSLASHSLAFKELFQARPEAGMEWLEGSALDVLAVMEGAGQGAGVKLLESECACSRATLFKTLKKLRYATVAEKKDGAYSITYPPARAFTKAFADNMQLIMQSRLKEGNYNVGIRVRKHVIVRSAASAAGEPLFAVTGMGALVAAGLQVVPTSYADYYFNLDGKQRRVSIEEAFVHAVLLSTLPQHSGDKTALALFLKTGPELNLGKLRSLAKTYFVEAEVRELRDAVGYYEKLREYE